MTQWPSWAPLGSRPSPRREIIITATAKAESSFEGTGRAGPTGATYRPLCSAVPRPVRPVAPKRGAMPWLGGTPTPWGRPSDPCSQEAFDRCLRECRIRSTFGQPPSGRRG
jgi:hypothetical protein